LHVIENKLFINKDGLFLIVSPPHTFERREAAGDFQQLLLPSYSNLYDSGPGTKLNSFSFTAHPLSKSLVASSKTKVLLSACLIFLGTTLESQ